MNDSPKRHLYLDGRYSFGAASRHALPFFNGPHYGTRKYFFSEAG